MSYQALARKWRPRNFSELVGQTHVRTALENALSQGRLHPALLFSGTRGVGKTTLARIIARCLNCETGVTATPCGECGTCTDIEAGRFVDLIEVDAASRTKVDETRELLDNVPYAPAQGRCKVYLIDEVHMLSKSSFNALLKTLEEPPSHVQFLLATTDPQKLPITVLSRCLQFHLKRIKADDIRSRMRFILDEEKLQADDDGLVRIARAADGSLRDGLSLLDQAIAFGAGQVTGESVALMLGSIERRDLLTMANAIADGDAAAAWAAIDAIDEQGLDFAEVLDELCRLWQRLAVGQQVPEAWDEVERADLANMLEKFKPEDLQVFYQIAVNARRDLDWAPDPRSGFEMAVLRTLAFLPDVAAIGGTGSGSVPPARVVKPIATPSASSAQQAKAPVEAKPDVAHAAVYATARNTRSERPAEAIAESPPEPSFERGSVSTPEQAQQLAWPDLLNQLELSGTARMVAEACEVQEKSATGIVLRLGSSVLQLCTAPVEQKIARALQDKFGTPFKLSLDRSQSQQAVIPQNPEEAFLANPGVRKAIALFDAEMQSGSLRISSDDANSPTIN